MRVATTLVSLRRHGTVGVWFFLLLMLLVLGERRLSEAHFNLRTWTIGLGSADALELTARTQEDSSMPRRIAIAVVMLIAASAPLSALAADVEGKVQSVDTAERTFTLENGTKIWLPEGVAIDSIKEGAEVTVSYEDKDGKPVASSVTSK